MGDLYRKLNQIGFTRESYGNALEIAQTHQHTVSIVNILVKLGNMSRDLGDIRQAVESYKEAASVAHDGNDLRGEAIAMSNLGDMYGMMGRNWQAVRSAEKGLKLAEKAGDDNSLMWTNYRLGMLHYKQEKWSKARPFIIKAEQLFAKARMQEMIEDTQRIRADLDRQEYGT
jgi:tetratricopeptide (TPR) repeat protein